MRKLVAAIAVATAAAFVVPTVAQAKGKVVQSKAQTMRGEAKDENIKTQRAPNDPAAAGERPGKSRGACAVRVDNWTPWYIDIYMDGDFRGTVAPWAEGYALAISGPTKFYGRADFTDGSWKAWGPQIGSCPTGGVYTWKLVQ